MGCSAATECCSFPAGRELRRVREVRLILDRRVCVGPTRAVGTLAAECNTRRTLATRRHLPLLRWKVSMRRAGGAQLSRMRHGLFSSESEHISAVWPCELRCVSVLLRSGWTSAWTRVAQGVRDSDSTGLDRHRRLWAHVL